MCPASSGSPKVAPGRAEAALAAGTTIVYLTGPVVYPACCPTARFISDDVVRELAERFALERELARQDDRAQRDRIIRESWARLDAVPHYEAGMYDEIGAPK